MQMKTLSSTQLKVIVQISHSRKNSATNLPITKAKRRRSLQTTNLTSIVKNYHCVSKDIIATSITKNSDSSFQVKLKEQRKTFTVDVGLEIYCSCNKK